MSGRTQGHKWHFFRAGGVDQVSLRDAKDLLGLPDLDQKLWVALTMPTTGVDVEPETLALLDHDRDCRWPRPPGTRRWHPRRTPACSTATSTGRG